MHTVWAPRPLGILVIYVYIRVMETAIYIERIICIYTEGIINFGGGWIIAAVIL